MWLQHKGKNNYILHGKNIVHLTNGSNPLHFFYDAQNKLAVAVFSGTAYAYTGTTCRDQSLLVASMGCDQT